MCQGLVSPLGKFGKHKISGNTKEAIYTHTKDVIAQAHTVALSNKKSFIDTVIATLENKLTTREMEYRKLNPIKKLYHKIFTDRYSLLSADRNKMLEFTKQNAQEAFDIMENLRRDNKKNVPAKIYKEYKKSLPTVKEIYKVGDYSHLAIRKALKKHQSSLIFKNKLVKTAVGFGAILLFAKPVNDLVEKHIMKKYVKPGIDNLSLKVANSHYNAKHSKIYMMIKG